MERWLLIADTHWDAEDEEFHPSYQLSKRFAIDFQPDGVFHLGDLFDFCYISKYDKDNLKKIRNKTFRRDFDLGNREFDFWQKVSPIVKVRQGNHDERVDRLIQKEPRYEGDIEVELRLDFAGRGIEFHREIELPTKLGHLHVIHGWYHNLYHTKKHLNEMGGNIVYGHLHMHQNYSRRLPAHEEDIASWSIACLTDKQPAWFKGRPTKWGNGFAIVYVNDNGSFNLYPIWIINDEFIWENHVFSYKGAA